MYVSGERTYRNRDRIVEPVSKQRKRKEVVAGTKGSTFHYTYTDLGALSLLDG